MQNHQPPICTTLSFKCIDQRCIIKAHKLIIILSHNITDQLAKRSPSYQCHTMQMQFFNQWKLNLHLNVEPPLVKWLMASSCQSWNEVAWHVWRVYWEHIYRYFINIYTYYDSTYMKRFTYANLVKKWITQLKLGHGLNPIVRYRSNYLSMSWTWSWFS